MTRADLADVLDADRDVTWTGLSPRTLSMWRLLAVIVVGVPGMAATFVAAAAGGTAAAATGLAVAALLTLALQVVSRRYAAWGYATRDRDLLIRRGVLVQRLSVVPYGRMQFVDVSQGPLDRRFDVASVVLHTAAAATDAAIPGLSADDATQLRDRLAELGEAHAAGL